MGVLPEARRSRAIGMCHEAAKNIAVSYGKERASHEENAALDCAEMVMYVDDLDGILNVAMRLHGVDKVAERAAQLGRINAFRNIAKQGAR